MGVKLWTRLRGVLLAAVSASAACGGTSTEPYQPVVQTPLEIPKGKASLPPSALACDLGTALSYDNFGQHFVLQYCLDCHSKHLAVDARSGSPTEVNFDTQADVQIWEQQMLGRLKDGAGRMPPGGGISSNDLKAAQTWLRCGAPHADDDGKFPGS